MNYVIVFLPSFEAIPPPKPDMMKPGYQVRGVRGIESLAPETSAPLRSMSVYNNAGGGCCIGSSGVLMADKSIKEIEISKRRFSINLRSM